MTYRECYERGRKTLADAGVPESALNARLLLEHVCGTDCNELLAHGERVVEEEQRVRYDVLIGRRADRVPLQHLTGEQCFFGRSFLVNEHVLIPRQDTEVLVEEALKKISRSYAGELRVLDMCTGSGCILISLIAEAGEISGVGVDLSDKALLAAKQNGERLLSKDRQPEWVCGDLFEKLDGVKDRFDMIVSNPPYIKSGEIEGLMPEVRDHEPVAALDGSGDGLCFYRRIVGEGAVFLKSGGWLLFEIGCDQAAEVESIFEKAGFEEISVKKDLAGLDRVAMGRKP